MAEKILALEDISFHPKGKQILNNITFDVLEGEIVTITGPSGGGKSTLLKLIGYLLKPTSGSIYYQNNLITEYEPTNYRKEVSYFFQNASLFDETVRDNLSFPSLIREDEFDEEKAKQGLKSVQLPEEFLDKSIQELSGGEKQRVALVRNLMYQPKVLLMDEVTSSLDKDNREVIGSFVRRLNQEQNITILWITHNQEEINISNRVIQIIQGEMEG